MALSNSGTNVPGPAQPRSPPSGAEPGSSDVGRGDAREVLAVQDAVAQLAELLAHGLIVVELVRLHQNVAHVNLVDDHLGLAAAPFVELHDVKTARRAHRFADIARLHLGDELENELRQLSAFAPAELAAVERRLAVRIGDRQLTEVLALGGARGDALAPC